MNNKDRAKLGLGKKRFYQRVWFWLLVVFVVVIGGCNALVGGASVAINNANNVKHTIVYSVTGSGSATITYASFDNTNNGENQLSNVALPWTTKVTGKGLFNSYSVTATLDENGGTATCSVVIDGKSVSSNSASGAFASATCSGSAS